MIPCRACALVHSPLERCEVARAKAGIVVRQIEVLRAKTASKAPKQAKCRENDAPGSPRLDDLEAAGIPVSVVHAAGGSRHGRHAKASAEARKAYRRAWMKKRRAGT